MIPPHRVVNFFPSFRLNAKERNNTCSVRHRFGATEFVKFRRGAADVRAAGTNTTGRHVYGVTKLVRAKKFPGPISARGQVGQQLVPPRRPKPVRRVALFLLATPSACSRVRCPVPTPPNPKEQENASYIYLGCHNRRYRSTPVRAEQTPLFFSPPSLFRTRQSHSIAFLRSAHRTTLRRRS